MRVVIRGKIHKHFKVYLSENYQAVTPENATWTFENKKVFCVSPRDQRIVNPTKQAADKDARKFKRLYILFQTSVPDWKFNVQVTFPDDEVKAKKRMEQIQIKTEDGEGQNTVPTIEDLDEGLSMQQQEAQAEERFNAIAKNFVMRYSWSRWESSKNFIESNVRGASAQRPEERADKRQRSQDQFKSRHVEAKVRREMYIDEKTKIKILQLNRRNLIEKERQKAFHEMKGVLGKR